MVALRCRTYVVANGGQRTISCVDPDSYGGRFLDFLSSVMRGGDISRRPEGLMPAEPTNQQPVAPAQAVNGTTLHGNGEIPREGKAADRPAIVGHLKAE